MRGSRRSLRGPKVRRKVTSANPCRVDRRTITDASAGIHIRPATQRMPLTSSSARVRPIATCHGSESTATRRRKATRSRLAADRTRAETAGVLFMTDSLVAADYSGAVTS